MSATTKKRASRFFAVVAAAALCLGIMGLVSGCSSSNEASSASSSAATQNETRTFTDSLGREVELPAQIDRIAPSGHTANQVLLTMAPEKMVSLSQDLTEDQLKYINLPNYADLPITGAAFGSKGDINKEAVAAADPQVIIDTGKVKDGLEEDMDTLQEQLGIPVVFIETKLEDYGAAYEMLGELLGMPERGKELSDYCAAAYKEVTDVMATIPDSERVNLGYFLGDAGLNTIAKNSYQGQVIDLCANNVAELDNVTGSGQGQEVSMEQIAMWDPELIIFAPKSIYDTVADDPAWATIAAVKSGQVYETPATPYNWLNNPPTVNQVMGMQWLPRLLYPDKFDTSIADVTKSHYKMFYGYDMSDQEVADMTAKALPKNA